MLCIIQLCCTSRRYSGSFLMNNRQTSWSCMNRDNKIVIFFQESGILAPES